MHGNVVHRRVSPAVDFLVNVVFILRIGRENGRHRLYKQRCFAVFDIHLRVIVDFACFLAGSVRVNGNKIIELNIGIKSVKIEAKLKIFGRRNVVQRHNIFAVIIIVRVFYILNGNRRAELLNFCGNAFGERFGRQSVIIVFVRAPAYKQRCHRANR